MDQPVRSPAHLCLDKSLRLADIIRRCSSLNGVSEERAKSNDDGFIILTIASDIWAWITGTAPPGQGRFIELISSTILRRYFQCS